MALSDSTVTFDKKIIKDILLEIVDSVDQGENAPKLIEAKKTAGNDMMKLMQYVFPTIVQIEMDIIKKYGFIDGREGMIQFTKLIVEYEKEDTEIAILHKIIRSHFLPLVTVASETTNTDVNPAQNVNEISEAPAEV